MPKEKQRNPIELILFGVVPEERPDQLHTISLINPGEDYIIDDKVKAYILLKRVDAFQLASDLVIEQAYERQVNEYCKMEEEIRMYNSVADDKLFDQVTEAAQHLNFPQPV